MNIRNRYSITTIIFVFLLAGCATETPIDPSQPIELGNLTFLAPTGEGWEYNRDDSSDFETALFIRGGWGSPAFGVMVWQVRVDDPVNSEEDIWAGLLEPYRDVWDAKERNELKKTECNPDQTLTAIGLLCQVEGEADSEGNLSFWGERIGDIATIEGEGHVYAFVLPNDNREIAVIEYFQQILPDVPPADTQKLLAEFARNVVLTN
jgi:hypothetical protein